MSTPTVTYLGLTDDDSSHPLRTRRVRYEGSDALHAGDLMCYSEPGDCSSIATPTSGGEKRFAGVVAPGSEGAVGPTEVELILPTPEGAACDVRLSAAASYSAAGNYLTLTSGQRYATLTSAAGVTGAMLGFNDQAVTPGAVTTAPCRLMYQRKL